MENYLTKINEVVEKDIIPLENDFLLHGFLNVLPRLNECREKVKKLGLWTPYLSTKYGGLGLTLLEFAEVSEILGKSLLGHYCFNSQAPDIGNIELLKDHANSELKEKFLFDFSGDFCFPAALIFLKEFSLFVGCFLT